jgi:hypothetical protein
MPLMNTSMTHAGQPSKVGGTVARVFGWIVLAVGWVVAALLAGLILLLGGQGAAAIVGGSIAVVASLVAFALLRGGKELKQSGEDAERAMQTQAIFALAGARGGVLKAWDVSQMLHLDPAAADDALTRLAKEQPDHVSVDIDDQGTLLYRFPAVHWGTATPMTPNAPPPHVRVGVPAPQSRVPAEVGEPLEDEFAGPPNRHKAR